MKVISTEKKPIKLWLDDIEDGALDQAKNLANLPFIFKHIAIMPDSHQGYGMPIGGVLATKDVVIPNAVGVDIGCGMCAVKTSLREISINTLKKIMGEIRKVIPVGFNKHKNIQNMQEGYIPEICMKEWENASKSLGTLGGGNHFIEIQKSDDGYIWIMIHSGSRNLGKKVADHYNKLAVELNEKWYSQVPKKWELAFLPIESEEGKNYISEMNYCVDFAFVNRKLMMDKIKDIFFNYSGQSALLSFDEMINIAHNYVNIENHFGENVWVHRKGATSAYEGQIGIIPGSQGTSSYIVEGLGNPESFKSCSHGAGRLMSRKKAIETLNIEEEKEKMGSVIHGMRHKSDLDEAPGSYKDINKVMDNQKDLVKIKVKLTPLAVIKG